MLIESYENRKDGFIIYSENKFDFITNFTRVRKENPDFREHLDFKEVSEVINSPTKKNLILYRLLTNDENLDPFSTKLGYFIKVENKIEVVYFDPVFIIKDLDNLKITIPKDEFRFKIQQVGYKTKSVSADSMVYEEQFSIEMSYTEAKNQNDSIFAETMLSFDGKKTVSHNIVENNSKENIFENISLEKESNSKNFYHIDRHGNMKNTSYTENNLTEKIKEEKNDFFFRVKLRKNRKEYESTTLKLFK